MPAVYPDYPCECCGNSHTLYYAGIGPSPDTSRPFYYTCDKLPVAMRVTMADGWRPAKRKPAEAIEIYRDDEADA